MSRRRLAVLTSGRGSNLDAIAAACASGAIDADLALVLCNVTGAGALDVAARHALPCRLIPHGNFASRDAFDRELQVALEDHGIDFVALAGFMRILGEGFVRAWEGTLVNIHPSLLPRYPGLHTHRRALEAGDREAGATVHFVTPTLDAGPAILRGRVPVLTGDSPASLAERVLGVEHRIYSRALAWCIAGEVTLAQGKAWKDGVAISDAGGLDLSSLEAADEG